MMRQPKAVWAVAVACVVAFMGIGLVDVLVALVILVAGRRHLAAAERRPARHEQLQLAIDEEPAGAIALERRAA